MNSILQQHGHTTVPRPSISAVGTKKYLRLSKEAPEALPVEYYRDNKQGPQTTPIKHQKEVVPLEQQKIHEPGLQIRMGREEKQRITSSDFASGLQLDDRDQTEIGKPSRRFSQRKIAIAIVVASIIIIAVVVPTMLLKRLRRNSHSLR